MIHTDYDGGPVQGARPAKESPRFLPTAAHILADGACTYEDRNKTYGENFRMVAPIMRVLFPEGLPRQMVHMDRWHLFELLIVKVTRFATSNLTHMDSIHDAMVYSAMIEASLTEVNATKAGESK